MTRRWRNESPRRGGGRGRRVRVRHIAETRYRQSVGQNPAWTANYEATKDLPAATGDDIVWADAVIFGSSTRFRGQTSQFRAFIDTLGGRGQADKVYAGFTSSPNAHGGQETTLINLYNANALRRRRRSPEMVDGGE